SQPQLLQVLQKWLGRKSITPQITALADTDLQASNLQSIDLQNTDSENIHLTEQSTPLSDQKTAIYPMVKDNERVRNRTEITEPPKVTRPLSLKKIRDDYLRDSQPRDDYRRETTRENQPRYESLRLHKQGQESLLYPPKESTDNSDKDITANMDKRLYEQTDHNLHQKNLSTMDTSDILDWQDALTRSANKPDLAAKLIIMMLDTINEEKQALTQAWEARDRNLLAQIAHRILGGSRYTGVPQLRQASQDLEDKCLLNVQHTTPAQFAMIEPYYEALLTALNNLQNVDLSAYPQLNYHRLSENDMTWKMI
ncbi:MAG TPA: hybrid sensor histidine kinase/response regulator, partial [Psychrobacter sp.]|nr:hybrid sensor histidine kinase/response regulator [Psychrobacter sp.]